MAISRHQWWVWSRAAARLGRGGRRRGARRLRRRSRHHLHEAAHVAERLHRAAVAVEEAEPAGDEALPAVLARARADEGEPDDVVRRAWCVQGAAPQRLALRLLA